MTPQEAIFLERLKVAQTKERECASDLREARANTRMIMKEISVMKRLQERSKSNGS